MNCQKSLEDEKAALYVVAMPIGDLQETTPKALKVLESVDVIAAEDTRNTLKLLTHFGIHTQLTPRHQHNEAQSASDLLELPRRGQDIALVNDAGYPLVSDPGCVITQKVIEGDFSVVPTFESNAMLNALISNGTDTRHFLFYGFLKSGEEERIHKLYELEYYSFTMVFYEAPHRAKKVLASCLEVLGNRNICLARELTEKHEEFLRGTIEEILEIVEELEGEMVTIMKGSRETKDPRGDSAVPLVHERINTYIREGLATNEAIKRVARKYGLGRNEIYRQYHGLC